MLAASQVGTLSGGSKPIFVTLPESWTRSRSIADTLFWGDIMMEHAMFFVMLMPGAELASPRGQAEQFQRSFADHLSTLRRVRLGPDDIALFNRTTQNPAQSFISIKQSMHDAQAASG